METTETNMNSLSQNSTRVELVTGRSTPFSPPSGPAQRLFQEPPAKSKFLAFPVFFVTFTGVLLGLQEGRAAITPGGDTVPLTSDTGWASGGLGYGNTYIGYHADSSGSLSVNNSSDLSVGRTYIGYATGSTGTVNIDGSGSTFENTFSLSIGLIIGYNGHGIFNITNGAAVTSSGGVIGWGVNGSGEVSIDGAGSNWTTTSLEPLFLGSNTKGILTITNGGLASMNDCIVNGNPLGETAVTVNGSGSTFTHDSMDIGTSGAGTVKIQNGATASGSGLIIGENSGSNGTLELDGNGSAYSFAGSALLGHHGSGSLTVSNGANFTCGGYLVLGNNSGSTGAATVDGLGSSLLAETQLEVGRHGTGTLMVRNHGTVTCYNDILVESDTGEGILSIEVTGNGMLKAGFDGSGDFHNDGTVNLHAAPSLSAGTYSPIEVGSISGSFSGAGAYHAYGGTWTANQFVVSPVVDATGGVVAEDLSGDRLSFDGGALVASFGTGAGIADFDATAISPGSIDGNPVLGAYGFTTDLTGSEVMLSFDLGTGLAPEDLAVWYRPDEFTGWTQLTPDQLNYASDGWLSFTVSGFSDYAVTVVPTPVALSVSTFEALGGGLFEMGFKWEPNRSCEIWSDPTLDFSPGTLVTNLVQGDSGDPGTISGASSSVVTTDANGDAVVRMTLVGPKNFVRVQSID